MKKSLLSFLCLAIIFSAFADDYSSVAGGAWDLPATWQNLTTGDNPALTKPGATDNVTVNNHSIIVDAAEECLSLTLANTGVGGINVLPGFSLQVHSFVQSSGSTGEVILGAGSVLELDGSGGGLLPTNSNINLYGAEGRLEINTASSVSISTGTSNVNCYGIVAVIAGTFNTDDRLVLKALSSTSFGRIAFTDYSSGTLPNNGRTVYTGTISGDVTMEKVVEGTNDPEGFNAGWRQWSFPLNVGASDITGLDIQGQGQATVNQRNAYSWNSEGDGASSGDPSPLANGKTLNSLAIAGWASGWEAVDESDLYRQGLTIWSTQSPNVNNAFGYDIDNTISITGDVQTGNVVGGFTDFDDTGVPSPTGTSIPLSQDPQLPDLAGASADDIGWVQLYNPWPTIIDTWGLLTEAVPDGGGWEAVAGGAFNNTYGAIHVWDAKLQQYIGWTTTSGSVGSIIYNTASVNTAPTQFQFDILPFQSFWVKGSVGLIAGPSIDFGLLYTKPTIDGPAYLKTSNLVDENLVALAVFDADSAADTWGVYYDQAFTQNFDMRGDLYKRKSTSDVPTLFSIEGGNMAQVVNRPHVAADTIQLYFESGKNNQQAHFHFNDAYGDNLDVVLHDKKTSTMHNLSQNPNYTFTHNTNNDPNRFELIINNSTISVDEDVLANNPLEIFMSGDQLVIKSENFTGPAQIDCYDMAGRLLFQRRVDIVAGTELRLTAPLAKNQINLIGITAKGQQYTQKLLH